MEGDRCVCGIPICLLAQTVGLCGFVRSFVVFSAPRVIKMDDEKNDERTSKVSLLSLIENKQTDRERDESEDGKD